MTRKTNAPAGNRGNGKGAAGQPHSCSYSSTLRPVFIKVRGQVIGQLRGQVFERRCYGSRHFLKRPPAICIDAGALADIEGAGGTQAEVTDLESGQVYRAPIVLFRERGFHVNRGFGLQVGLCLGEWQTGDGEPQPPEPPQPPALNAEEDAARAVPLPLFAELAL